MLDLFQSLDFDVKIIEISKKTFIVQKWKWDYLNCLEFQRQARSFVEQDPSYKIYIFCNHPKCFTYGRGLQKVKGATLAGLKDLDLDEIELLAYPLHYVERGGGLTFHYEGQWVFYPIVHLIKSKISIKELINWMLELVSFNLQKMGVENIDYQREFLGLWVNNLKMASVGVAIKKFVTYHGLALNIYRDQAMFNSLAVVHPCGLSNKMYCCVDDFIDLKRGKLELISSFNNYVIDNLLNLKSRI